MKKLMILTLPIILVANYSCKKEIYGCTDPTAQNYSTEATSDDGSCIAQVTESDQINTEQFALTFGPSQSYDYYLPSFDYVEGDLIIIETKTDDVSGNEYWSALPFASNDVIFWGEYGEQDGDIWVYSDYVSTGDPAVWTSTVTIGFRAVHVKHKTVISTPGIKDMSIDKILELK